MICKNCSYYSYGECLLDLNGAYNSTDEPADDIKEVMSCENFQDKEE